MEGMKAMNTWVVSLMKNREGLVNWVKRELDDMYHKTTPKNTLDTLFASGFKEKELQLDAKLV